MKISYHGYLQLPHSWSVVANNLCSQLIKLGHDLDIKSTNGESQIFNDLKPRLMESFKNDYDLQLSYTAFQNFSRYLSHGNKNRFGIWTYEFTRLPEGFAKNYKVCDKILAPSNFSKEIFINNGIPENYIEVVPHGVNFNKFNNIKFNLRTNKSRKILSIIGQPHIRKNIAGMLEVYGKAFTSKDDICWVIKIVDKKPQAKFEINFSEILKKFKNKYPNHAEIEVITNYVENIEELYNSCDIFYSLSNTECFLIPALDSLLSGKITIVSNYGGQLDFCNKSNSLLVDGKLGPAPTEAQYWSSSRASQMFFPSEADAIDKLRQAVYNFDVLKAQFKPDISSLLKTYSWESVTKQILDLAK